MSVELVRRAAELTGSDELASDEELAEEIVEDGDRYLVLTDVRSRARGSGIEVDASGAGIWTAAGGRLKHFRLLASDRISRDEARAALRRESSAEGP